MMISDYVVVLLFAIIVTYVDRVSKIMCIPKLAKLTAANDSMHVIELHEAIANQSEPSETDPGRESWLVRLQICEQIVRTSYFRELYLRPVPRTSYVVLPYAIRAFTVYVNRRLGHFKDFCFKCYFKKELTGEVGEFYVSKEYNVSPVPSHYKPGRFVVGRIIAAYLVLPHNNLILTEESANFYTDFDFNVELHYLRTRKYIQQAKEFEMDPLCSIVSADGENPRNQHRRLCVAVLTSSYFENTTFDDHYPGGPYHRCVRKKITFRTPDAIEEAAGHSYYERMTRCSRFPGIGGRPDDPVLFISRSYFSNQVFVLTRDAEDRQKIHLQNLITNVSIADELNSLDFVEY